jgi:hypothetical protein
MRSLFPCLGGGTDTVFRVSFISVLVIIGAPDLIYSRIVEPVEPWWSVAPNRAINSPVVKEGGIIPCGEQWKLRWGA